MNRIFLFAPFTMDSLPGVSPLRPVGNTAGFAGFASRPVHSIVVPSPFSCVPHLIGTITV